MTDSLLMMRCAQCGEMNQLPVVHCKKCGARLDFETAEKHMIQAAGKTRDRHGNPLTIKLSGAVEAWFENPAEDAEGDKAADAE